MYPRVEVTSSPPFVDRTTRRRCRRAFPGHLGRSTFGRRPTSRSTPRRTPSTTTSKRPASCSSPGTARAYLVDPLAPLDIPALLARLAPRRLLMHGADYDLRLLFRGYGFRATSLFDTMLAAQLLGEKEIGLAALLSARAGVTLDKTHQRADWSETAARAADGRLRRLGRPPSRPPRGVAHARPRGEGPSPLARRGVRPPRRDGLFRGARGRPRERLADQGDERFHGQGARLRARPLGSA